MSNFDAHKDYYKILRVREDADAEEITRAYKQLARQHHPDYGGNEEAMKTLNEAHAALSDRETRRAYNDKRGIQSRREADADAPNISKPFDIEAVPGGDVFGLIVAALFCLGLGLPFLILIETQWVFFLWPLRILAFGIVLIGILLAHAAFRHKFQQMLKTKRRTQSQIVIGEIVFWSMAAICALMLYMLMQAISLKTSSG
jgi:hypothetical protein